MISTQDSSIDELLNNVIPRIDRSEMNIIPDHITMLQGSKSKKQLKRKRKTNKSSTLTRQQFTKLGLNNLPCKKMNFKADGLPLNKLWIGYMKDQLNLNQNSVIPECYEGGYEAFSKMLSKFDLHGAIVTVVKAKCPGFLHKAGIVVMETKNVLKILTKENTLKIIPKNDVVIELKVYNATFMIYGKNIIVRPAERSVKKIKTCPSFDL